MSRKIIWILIALFVIILVSMFILLGIKPAFKTDSLAGISMPDGFKIDVFAGDLDGSLVSYPGPNPGPRMMLLRDGVLFVTIPDRDNDKKADEVITFIDNLNRPHGTDFYEGWFYIAEENRVIKVKEKGLKADKNTLEVLIDDLPAGGHFTRTIKVHDGSIYLSTGSSCNVCYEKDERRGAITKCNLDGKECRVFAKGLRNAVGFVFHPITDRIYA